jgi:hypothetical protein
MNAIANLLLSLEATVVYESAYRLSQAVLTFLTPILFLMAIAIRVMETQLGSLAGNGRYATMFRDIAGWGFVIGAYVGIGALIIEFFNPIYAWIDSIGSVKLAMASYAAIMDKNQQQGDVGTLAGIFTTPYLYTGVAALLYYGSLIFVVAVAVFFKIAKAAAFGLGYAWGLVAIPVSISESFRILRGWGLLMAFALIWPIIEGFSMALFASMFAKAADAVTAINEPNAQVRAAHIMLLFSVLNLVLLAAMIAAPFLTNALVSNAASGAAIAAPFLGAAAAAGIGMLKATQSAGGRVLGGGNGGGGNPLGTNPPPPQPRVIPPAPSPRTAPPTPGRSVTPSQPGVAAASDVDAAAPAPSAADAEQSRRAAKARRGVFVTRTKRAKG